MRAMVSSCLTAVVLTLSLASAPALAAKDAGHGQPAGEHAPSGEHAEEGGHGGEHHPSYSGDADHDGTANWLDADSDDYVAGDVLFHAFNFLIFIGLIWWGAGSTVRDSVRARAITIKRDIGEASELRAAAQTRHDGVAARLAALESEIAAMHQRAKDEGVAEEQAIRVRAEAAAKAIAETAQRQIRDESVRARALIRREAVEIAVKLAEEILTKEIQPTDQRRLAQQFLDTIQQDGGSHV